MAPEASNFQVFSNLYTVKSDFFARTLFSRKALKEIFTTLKNRD